MKLWDIIKTVGAGVVSTMVPGGPFILAAINECLPDDKKLPDNATGQQVQSAIAMLPPEARTSLLDKQFDVDITEIEESHATVRMMLDSDARNPHTTRPLIALGAFQLIAAISLTVTSLWAYAVGKGNEEMTKTVMDGWPFVAAIIAPFVALLMQYFGKLEQESRNRLNAARGGTLSNDKTVAKNLVKSLARLIER